MIDIPFSVLLERISGKIRIDSSGTAFANGCRGIRILSRNDSNFQNNFLYLTDSLFLLSDVWEQRCPNTVSFVLPEGEHFPDHLHPSWKGHCFAMYTERPLSEVRDLLQDILDDYKDWYESCLQMIIDGTSLTAFLDQVCRPLSNPAAFFDSAGVLIHYTGEFEKDTKGTLWSEVLESGFAPAESVYPDEQSRIMREARGGARLITGVFRKDPSYHFITIPVISENKAVAAFGLLDINAPFTDAQYALAEEIGSITSSAIRSKTFPLQMHDEENYCILRLLQNQSVDERVLRRYLADRRWQADDTMYLIMFPLPDQDHESTQISAFIYRLSHVMPLAVLLPFENSIIGVVKKKDFDPDDQKNETKLLQILDKLSLRAYISGSFHLLHYLSTAYGQCRLMLKYAGFDHSFRSLLRFEDTFKNILFGLFKENNDIRAFCHPKVLSLWDSGKEKDRVLVHDLKYYLLNGRSIANTTRYLNLHRNTFIYRLQRLEEILQLPLDSSDENTLLHLLLSCYICECVNWDAAV